jgi:hypothetical protein
MLDREKTAYRIDHVAIMDLPLRKVVYNLYEAASGRVGRPLSLEAAERMSEEADAGDFVFIVTGFPIPPKYLCETDGPPGASVLASVAREIGLRPVFVTDKPCEPVVRAVADESPIELIPRDHSEAEREAERLFSKYDPSIVVAIERPGWNVKREYHTMRGYNISRVVGKTDYLFEAAGERGVLTVGVGDGGNELGLGLLVEEVGRTVPYGERCQCPCGGGIAAATRADVLVVAGTSNWGAYAIASMLALVEGVKYGHDGKREVELLERVIGAGGIDGVTGEPTPTVDGIPTSVDRLVVDLIRTIAGLDEL